MWEVLTKRPLGSLSKRNFLSIATALIVALLANLTLISQPSAAAADLSWHDNQIVRNSDGATFTQDDGDQKRAVHAPDDASAVYVAANPQASQVQVIFFPKGSDPASSKTAQFYIEPDVKDAKSISIEPKADPPLEATGTATNGNSCNMDGIGWIVCPVSKAIATGIDTIYGIISTFFVVNPLTSSQQGLFPMWEIFRNFANIAFVIAFMIIIYGQVTGGVISNYTIKKMLPRLIIAAILVNLSYWICAIAIDVSNITGYAIHALFESLRHAAGAPNSDAATGFAPTWAAVTGAVLAGGAGAYIGGTALIIASGTWTGFIFLLLGALMPAIFAALVAIAVLAARQALITVFVILSPLAFVAYILPSTHEWFTRWRKTFTTMLIMFPAFSLVFSGAQLAGTLIIQNAGGEKKDLAVVILGMAVQVVPLFITPILIRLSSGVMSTVANFANNKQKGLFDRTKNWSNTRRSQEQALGTRRRAERAKKLGITDGRRRSAHRNRAVRTAQNLGYRANPLSNAYNQEYRRTEREEMMKANQATTAGLFTQTEAGYRVHRQNKNAGLEQHGGEAANQNRWTKEVYGNPATGSTGDAYRQHLHHQAHIDTGETKVIEDRATAHAERDLQTRINADAALRDLKVRTDVDAAHAKFQSANVEGEGKLTFQNEINSNRALRQMNVETSNLDKEATAVQNTLQKQADADWNYRSRHDDRLQTVRLTEARAENRDKHVQEQWNSFIENIKAKGGNAPEVTIANQNLAESIRATGNDLRTQTSIQEAAKVDQQLSYADTLQKNKVLLRQAAGVGGEQAMGRILARAKTTAFSPIVDSIKDIQNTIDHQVATDVPALKAMIMSSDATLEQRVAWTGLLTKRGGPGQKALREVLNYMDTHYLPESDEVQNFKELLGSTSEAMKSGKDVEFWLTNTKDTTTGGLSSFHTLANSDGTWSAVSATAFANMNQVAQMKALRTLAMNNEPQFRTLSELVRNDPQAMASLKTFVAEALTHDPSETAYWNDQRARALSDPDNSDLW